MEHFAKTASAVLGLLCLGLHSGPLPAEVLLETRQVALSENIKTGDRIGRMRFLGMLELPDIKSHGVRLSQLSGLAWDEDDGVLYAISDKGGLFHLHPEFDGDILTGLNLLQAVALREPESVKPGKRYHADPEGLDVLKGRNGRGGDTELIVSFEGVSRIARYRPDGRAIGDEALPAPINDARKFQDTNSMLESVCADTRLGILATPEVPLRGERPGVTRLFSLGSKSWVYPLDAGSRISALECLGKNRLMVLESNFRGTLGRLQVFLKLTTLPAQSSAVESVTVETVAVLDTAKGHLIDNFEGLARHRGNRFFMVSDNNDLFVQRTLLMYFELLED